jgi:Rrf2 family protein
LIRKNKQLAFEMPPKLELPLSSNVTANSAHGFHTEVVYYDTASPILFHYLCPGLLSNPPGHVKVNSLAHPDLHPSLTGITTWYIDIRMKISKKTDYALRALFTLVEHYGTGPIPIRELARRNDIPKRFLEQILLALKEKGWVKSEPGVRGGYILAKAPAKISLGEVVRHFNGLLAPIECVSVHGYHRCSQEPVCRFRRVFLNARNYIAQLMDNATLESVAKGLPVTGQEVFAPGLMGGEGI